jgi:hypothetical protein
MDAERTALGIAGLALDGHRPAFRYLLDHCESPEYSALLRTPAGKAEKAVKNREQ